MSKADRMAERLPSFYDVWRRDSLLRRILDALAVQLEAIERMVYVVMESRWIDAASGEALDLLGSMFGVERRAGEGDDLYRRRIIRSVQSFMGGGTVEAVKRSVAALLNIPGDEVRLVENPVEDASHTVEVFSGAEWRVDCGSVLDSEFSMEISLAGPSGKVSSPEVRCVETGFTFRLLGDLSAGSVLTIDSGGARLNGSPLSDGEYVLTGPLTLPRGVTTWRYSERLAPSIGVFNSSRFDESVYAFEAPATKITLRWRRHVPAFFEIHVPGSVDPLLLKAVKPVVDRVKAGGVGYRVVVGEE